ncbi:InlB B-repeat-containing protein [Clostridium sp. AM58-1XD]|uniref:InlB B-repeat-containing protein n=1 Tax=Clostridium sp. AM58-1XD TaxID=2292307 RepID=UPI0015F4B7D7|nr:InlB B-repeat-containing protein [Clostridium sp. AM58-1XD]
MGENPDGSRYDVWMTAVKNGEEEHTWYYMYGYMENGLGRDQTEGRWYLCDESGRVSGTWSYRRALLRSWSPASAAVTRSGNTVTIRYVDELGRCNYDNSKSKYAFSIGILINHVSLSGESYAGFYPETSSVTNHTLKTEYDGICQYLSWKEEEDGSYVCEKVNPTVPQKNAAGRVKIADKITGTKREWYEEYERESTGFSAVPHVECTLVLTNPSPYITGYGYGIRYLAADGEGGDNNFIRSCVGNIDLSEVCIQAHEHSGLVRTEPDCTQTGSVTGTCSSCGMEVNEVLPALGHQNPADYDTSSVPGYKIKNCLRCGIRLETIANLYYVEYHGNGSTGGSTEKTTHYIDTEAPLASNGFTRTGYRFMGWNRTTDGTGTPYQESQKVKNLTLTGNETIHLYARWQINSYSVTFDGNGGTEGRSVTKEYDSAIGRLPVSTRTGYQFTGWWDDRTGGTRITENSRIPARDLTVYARWTPNSYQIHFDGGGAEEGKMENEMFFYDEEKELTANAFRRTGYRFAGWEEDGKAVYRDREKIRNLTFEDQKVIRLKAKWLPVTYIISWHGNGDTGGQMPVQILTYDRTENLTGNTFQKTGYQFTGWSLTESGEGERLKDGQAVKNLASVQDDTIHLFAQWDSSEYRILFMPNGGTCLVKTKAVRYDRPVGELPVPTKEDYAFLGWFHEKNGGKITEDTVYRDLEDIRLTASWKLRFEDLGNGTNRRPGQDGVYDTADDKYYTNGYDQEAGTDDDKRIYPGKDRIFGTADDFYIGESGERIFAGMDHAFGTEDDYRISAADRNERPGTDRIFGTEDDELWWNGRDGIPGNSDDKKIDSGGDGTYGTSDDYYEADDENGHLIKIHAGQDKKFGTLDDYTDNGDGTNTRPGKDGIFGTEDDERWWNGEDEQPGTEDDRQIYPGPDGVYGTEDDWIDNGDGTNTRPGKDGMFGTEDDEIWWNGTDGKPGTEDDKPIHPGEDGKYGTEDDWIDNGDGTNTRPGKDGAFGTEDDEIWGNGEDGKPGTEDDRKKEENSSDGHRGGSGSSGRSSSGSSGGGSGRSGNIEQDQNGTWVLDKTGWWYRFPDGTWPEDGWFQLTYQGKTEWYHFDEKGYMQTGWFTDQDGKRYYLHGVSDGTMGRMYTDWNMIDGKWYFFNPVSDGSKGALCVDMEFTEGMKLPAAR